MRGTPFWIQVLCLLRLFPDSSITAIRENSIRSENFDDLTDRSIVKALVPLRADGHVVGVTRPPASNLKGRPPSLYSLTISGVEFLAQAAQHAWSTEHVVLQALRSAQQSQTIRQIADYSKASDRCIDRGVRQVRRQLGELVDAGLVGSDEVASVPGRPPARTYELTSEGELHLMILEESRKLLTTAAAKT